MQSIVIIGSGLAGYLLVKGLRDKGHTGAIHVITEEAGDFYTKPMLSSACGLNKTPEDLITMTAQVMQQRYDFTLLANRSVIGLDRHAQRVQLSEGQTLSYDACVLALGASPKSMAFAGADMAHRVNRWSDYAHFRTQLTSTKRLGIIGAGLVGTEFAADLSRLPIEIALLHAGSDPLDALLPQTLCTALRTCLVEHGVAWHGGVTVDAIEKNDDGSQILSFSDGRVPCDQTLIATGLVPNILLAKQAGLDVRHGIVVNQFCQTSDPHIYALGDCAEVARLSMCYVAPIRHCVASLVARFVTQTPVAVAYPVMPITIKTPMMPIVVVPPPPGAKGQWQVEGSAPDFTAIYLDAAGCSIGFALSGQQVKQRAHWMKQVPAWPMAT